MSDSPCNNKCALDKNLNLCIGCFRTPEEIAQWNNFTAQSKEEVKWYISERAAQYHIARVAKRHE